jgi:hypothetical protein
MTIVKLTQVITNAPIVVRNMYRPIDPIGLNIPADGTTAVSAPKAVAPPEPIPPNAPHFMLSQNGLAKAKPLKVQS